MLYAPDHRPIAPARAEVRSSAAPRSVLVNGVRAARAVVWGASAAVLVLVVGSLIWGGSAPDILPDGMLMRPQAARVFGLLALALFGLGSGFQARRLRSFGSWCARLALLATVVAGLAQLDIGRRQIAAVSPDALAQIDQLPAIPSVAAAALAVAFLCLHRRHRAGGRLVVWLAFGAGFVGLVATFGHLFDAPRLYFASTTNGMAPMGAVSLLLLSAGAWCAQPDRGAVGLLIADDAGGASLRHLLPAVLVLVPALAWLRVSAVTAGVVGIEAAGALFVALVMAILGGALAIDAGRLSRLDRRNREAAADLAALADDLERQVAARTRELSYNTDELRRQVAERQSAEALFRGVFEAVPDAVLVVGPNGLIELANRRCEAVLGREPAQLLGMPINSLVPPDMLEVHRRRWRRFLAQPTPHHLFGEVGDLSVLRADGTQLAVEVALGALPGDARARIIVSIRDIEARVVATQKAREADQRFRILVDNLPIGIFVADDDADGRLLEANPALLRIIEADSMRQLLSSPISAFHAMAGERATMLAEAHRSGGLRQTEFSGTTLRGRGFVASLTVVPRQTSDGVVWDGLLEDVTERKQAEQRILDLNAALTARATELEVTNRELEAFSYSVSHDLRAPLRAIDGFSRIIEQDGGDRLGDANRERLSRVRHNAQRMGILIDDLLNLARLTRTPLHRRAVDLTALATDIVAGLRDQDPQREVEVDISPNLTAWADVALLRVVLVNLLDNAWKFTGQTAAPRISVESEGDEPVFVVRDNGAGFDMAHAEQLFGPFQRLHAMDEFPGTGVGLATVQRIIHKHGGRIWAEAQPMRGASFRFTLPQEAPT